MIARLPAPQDLCFRAARSADAHAIAALHADSWRRHYRGAYSDAFLDDDLLADRVAVWSERLSSPSETSRTILAEGGDGMVGFVHVVIDDDLAWGTLIDNLHVVRALKGRGIGTQLLAITAQAALEWSPSAGLYLWVLEQNSDARAFYTARGAIGVGRAAVPPPGGDAARLSGHPTRLRYAWRDPAKLLAFNRSAPRAGAQRLAEERG